MQNYHRHTSYSNIFIADSAAINEDYAKRAVELGHKVISSVEHGWQGYYYETFELAQKYNLKFVFGAEAYWVKDRNEKDRTNSHIIMKQDIILDHGLISNFFCPYHLTMFLLQVHV